MADSVQVVRPPLAGYDERPSLARRPAADFIGCAVFLALAAWAVVRAPSISVSLIPVIAYEGGTGLAFLMRGRARATLPGVGARIAAYGGTFALPAFLVVAARWFPSWLTAASSTFPATGRWMVVIGNVLASAGALLSMWGLWYLRDSLSLVPAARKLVTTGAYAVARHPLYLAYLLSYTGVVLQHPTVPMLVAWSLWLVLILARIEYEERILMMVFPEYAAYRARVGAFGPKPLALLRRG